MVDTVAVVRVTKRRTEMNRWGKRIQHSSHEFNKPNTQLRTNRSETLLRTHHACILLDIVQNLETLFKRLK